MVKKLLDKIQGWVPSKKAMVAGATAVILPLVSAGAAQAKFNVPDSRRGGLMRKMTVEQQRDNYEGVVDFLASFGVHDIDPKRSMDRGVHVPVFEDTDYDDNGKKTHARVVQENNSFSVMPTGDSVDTLGVLITYRGEDGTFKRHEEVGLDVNKPYVVQVDGKLLKPGEYSISALILAKDGAGIKYVKGPICNMLRGVTSSQKDMEVISIDGKVLTAPQTEETIVDTSNLEVDIQSYQRLTANDLIQVFDDVKMLDVDENQALIFFEGRKPMKHNKFGKALLVLASMFQGGYARSTGSHSVRGFNTSISQTQVANAWANYRSMFTGPCTGLVDQSSGNIFGNMIRATNQRFGVNIKDTSSTYFVQMNGAKGVAAYMALSNLEMASGSPSGVMVYDKRAGVLRLPGQDAVYMTGMPGSHGPGQNMNRQFNNHRAPQYNPADLRRMLSSGGRANIRQNNTSYFHRGRR